MKIKHFIASFLSILFLTLSMNAVAENCYNLDDIDGWDGSTAKSILENFSTKYSAKDGENYVICFEGTTPYKLDAQVNITTANNQTLKISGAIFSKNYDSENSLLLISGPAITLEDISLTGNQLGVAIQITATGSVIIQGTDAAHPAIVSGFAKGIEVASGGKLKLGDNVTFKTSDNGASLLVMDGITTPILSNPVEGAISKVLIGGKKSDTDPDKVEFVMGALPSSICEATDKGVVDLYISVSELYGVNRFSKLTDCNSPTKLDKDWNIEFELVGGTKTNYNLVKDTCVFKCENDLPLPGTPVSFIYSYSDRATPFAYANGFIDIEYIVSVMGPMTIFDSGSEANEENNGGAIVVTGTPPPTGLPGECVGDDCLAFDPADDGKTQTDDEKISGGGSAAASASGCGGGQSMIDSKHATALQILAALIPLFAIPPLVYCRKKR